MREELEGFVLIRPLAWQLEQEGKTGRVMCVQAKAPHLRPFRVRQRVYVVPNWPNQFIQHPAAAATNQLLDCAWEGIGGKGGVG